MTKLIAAALLLLSSSAKAFITVNEALPTTKDAVYVGTTTPQVLLNGGTYYAGLVPSVSLYVASNTVLGNCVVYSTGSIMCLGVRLSTGDPVGAYVPYTGATANVNLGAKTLTTTGNIQVGQVGAGTSASSNFYFDGLSAAGGGYVRIGAGVNQATGYYWGGTRGYSLQERYDLAGTPFTLHDELNNVDRFSLGVSGDWYFPYGVTTDSFTSLGAIKGAGTGLTGTGASFTAGKATALAAAGTSAPSGQLSRGVDASGNSLNAVVVATVDGSTNPPQSVGVQTALAGKAASFAGISSSCASGFHISTDTYVNGILTGGSCVADGSGGGGGSSTMTITAVSDNFLGSVTGSLKTFTLSNTPANAAALQCHLDGLLLSQTSDYTYTAPSTIALATAPAANSTGFECDYFVNTSTLPAAFILNSSQTVSGATIFQSSITLGPVVINSTANYSALTVNAEWSLISSTHPAGSSSFWFYNIISTAPSACKSHPRYKVDFDLVAGSASGEYLLQFGATGASDVDSSLNYHGSMTGNANAGSLILNGWQDHGCLLTYQSSTLSVRNGFPWQGTFEFSPMIGNDNFVYGGMLTDGNYGSDLANRGAILINSCTWPFSSRIGPLSFMKFSTTNGTTVTGDVSLWMRCTQ